MCNRIIAGSARRATVKKGLTVAMALCAVACSKGASPSQGASPTQGQNSLSPVEISKLGLSGFVLFECSVYADMAGMDKATGNRLFKHGHEDLTRFIDLGQTAKPKEMEEAIQANVPVLVMQHMGGPSTEFSVGRVFEATSVTVEDELYQRETWMHQKFDPNAPWPSPETVKAAAAQHFRDKNCEML
jgi:hypothetical protein